MSTPHLPRRKMLLSLLALPLVSSCNDGGGKDDAAATDTTLDTKTDTTADTTGTTGKTDTTDTATTPTQPATPTKPATPSGGYDLSGTWGWTKTGFYKLKQTGASLQGTYYDPGIPGARGAIAGTVSGSTVKMTVIVTYQFNPSENFTAQKTGVIHSSTSMTLTITGGPKYVGQVQQWHKITTLA
ncbi:MAG: hypothetical protein U1F87_18875 [Kiritimatiellia bacterium]